MVCLMQADEEMSFGCPAKLVREILGQLDDWFRPASLREKFLRVGEDMSYLDSHQWEVKYGFVLPRLRKALDDLAHLLMSPSSLEHMDLWEDDVLFFYMLHWQMVLVRLYGMRDEEVVPAPLEAFWEWAMKPSSSWITYTFPTKRAFVQLARRPVIWQFFAPCDVTIEEQ